MANGPVYEFGPYRLEPAEHRVACGGQVIPLPPKAFDVLVFLVERSGQLVSKQELLDHIWGDVQVEEGNLTLNVSIIRRALGSAAPGKQFLETVPKRGYRFTPEVTRVNDGQYPSAAAVGSARTKPF